MKSLAAAWTLLRALWHAVAGWLTIVFVFPRLSPPQRDARVQVWARQMLAVLGIDLRLHGTPPAGGPVLLVANHISWLDILVMHAARHCRFVSKSELRGWPLIGTLAMPLLVWAMAAGFVGDGRFDMAVDFGRITFCYVGFISLLPHLPGQLVQLLTPYMGTPRFAPRLPDRFLEWVIDQTFVVALPEEFFFRGYLQGRLSQVLPFAVNLPLSAAVFALGHLLVTSDPGTLAVFFPGLLFGLLRQYSGSVLAGTLFHALCNLLIDILHRSLG